MDLSIKCDPHQDLLIKLTNKAWGIWWANKRAGHPISYEDAAVEALKGNNELALPSDALTRVSSQNIVDRMRATSRDSKEKKRNAKEVEKAQSDLFVVGSSAAPSLAKKKKKVFQGVLL